MLIRRTPLLGAQRGLSVVELMVGVAIGLFIVAGGAKLLADGLIGNRRVIVESRISQDLRAATDVIARDLRRAGYWGGSLAGVTGTPALNGYRITSPSPATGQASAVTYSYSRDNDNAVNAATEDFGFRRVVDAAGIGRIEMHVGTTWQPLTDPNSVHVTAFTITPMTGEVSLGDSCRGSPISSPGTPPSACCRPHDGNALLCKPPIVERTTAGYTPSAGVAPPAGVVISANCPELVIRRFNIDLQGQARPPNGDVRRQILETVRVRNDEVSHVTCP